MAPLLREQCPTVRWTERSVHPCREVDADSDYSQQAGDSCDYCWPPGGIERIAVVSEESCDLAVLHKAQNQEQRRCGDKDKADCPGRFSACGRYPLNLM